jgi:Cu+-exporting ATPase
MSSKEHITEENCNIIELDIEGMDCPACALKIEKKISKLKGIESIKVNLASETASIEYSAENVDLNTIKSEISSIGYRAVEQDIDKNEEEAENQKKLLVQKLKNKIIVSIVLSAIIFSLGMKEHIGFLSSIPTDLANWISLPLSTIVVFWCGLKFLKGFWLALKTGMADMDSLIAIGTLSAYIYSLFIIFFPHLSGEHNHTVYFESAAMIITFIMLGNYLEAKLKSKTQYAIKSLTGLQVKDATVVSGSAELKVPIKNVKVNDVVLVKPGERIPVDGVVTEGSSAVDESMITGESIPDEKVAGKKVIGGTINLNGFLKIRAEKVGKDSFLAKIINLVKDAQKSKPKIQRIADKVSAVFVPIVIVIALGTFFAWFYPFGQTFSYSLLKSVAVLIIACPCALGLATPIAIVLGVGKAAENKILFNNAEAIENVNKIDTIVFDKTGTLTYADFTVSETIALNGLPENEILHIAASIENYSEHPIAKAIVDYYKKSNSGNTDLYNVDDFKMTSGIGVEANIAGKLYRLGGANMVNKYALTGNFDSTTADNISNLKNIYLFERSNLIGEIRISDRIKPEASRVINKLKADNYNISLISGDSKQETEKIASELGIEDFHFQILPDGKQELISAMQSSGKKVAMVGDGINDAPSLSKADLGIAIGTGQDIAIESADVILVKGDLENLLALFKISNKTIRIIKQNIFWAFFYNAAAIPIAAGILVPWGITISPVMASMFMALSDVVTVLGNSMRLKYMKIH